MPDPGWTFIERVTKFELLVESVRWRRFAPHRRSSTSTKDKMQHNRPSLKSLREVLVRFLEVPAPSVLLGRFRAGRSGAWRHWQVGPVG
jgi:hypothetical protein